MTNHTPTPWNTARVFVDSNQDDILLFGKNSDKSAHTIADCGVWSDPTDQANAQFIVHAVNNHDSLLKACKTLQEWLNSHFGTSEHRKLIDDAIAQAEVKS